MESRGWQLNTPLSSCPVCVRVCVWVGGDKSIRGSEDYLEKVLRRS